MLLMDWSSVSVRDVAVALKEVRSSSAEIRSHCFPAWLEPCITFVELPCMRTGFMDSQVDWNTKPRPPSEFIASFSAPNKRSKWDSRLKCNGALQMANGHRRPFRLTSRSTCAAL